MSDFISILESLKGSKDSSRTLNLLVAIRKQVEWPKCKENINTLREKHCLLPVVLSLQSQQKSVINVALSILGNCCLDAKCVNEVKRLNILTVLHQLMERYGIKEDSINGRMYRLLGNLCHHKESWPVIIVDKKPQIITYTVEFLKFAANTEEDTVTEATLVMGIRFIRDVLNSQTIVRLVKLFGVLKPLGLLLLKYSNLWENDKQHVNLLRNIIRTIYEFSKYECCFSILEMKSTEKGNSLVCLSNVLLLEPRLIVKIIMNFLHTSHLQSDLPVPEICDGFINILKKKTALKELHEDYVEYIQCLCCLFDHPANRNANRCGKSIPLLIDTLNSFQTVSNKSLTCCILILTTLNKCRYNDTLIIEQLKSDVITVLIGKLKWLVGSSDILSLRHERKRKNSSRHASSSRKKSRMLFDTLKSPAPAQSSDEEDALSYRQLYSSSPSASSGIDSLSTTSGLDSPGTSSGLDSPSSSWSTRSSDHLCDFSCSDADDYSPVCSEADPEEFTVTPNKENFEFADCEVLTDFDEIPKKDDKSEKLKANTASLRSRILVEIIRLLKTYIKVHPPHPQLASSELLLTLIKCSSVFGLVASNKLDTIDVVCRILQFDDYLIPLMKTDFIPIVYELTNVRHDLSCVKCVQLQNIGSTILSTLCNLAESSISKGEVAHQMLQGSEETRQQLTLIIPYIIKNRSTLSKLMLRCGGLETLMNLAKSEKLREKSINALCVLTTKKLGISNLKKSLTYSSQSVFAVNNRKLQEDSLHAITFVTDDGNSVKANGQFLSKKSDYFNALLNGHFKESDETQIELHNVSGETLECLFNLLQCNFDGEMTELLNLDLHTLLEVIAVSDRYLITNLCVLLTEYVKKFRICPDTVPVIYKWSLESQTSFLRVESITYALMSDIAYTERLNLFNNLFNLEYLNELIDDIKILLTRHLELNGYS